MSQTEYEYPRDHAFWNPIFIAFFLFLIVSIFAIIYSYPHAVRELYRLDFLDISLIALAAFRLIRLVSYDKIFQFFRDLFLPKQADGTRTKPEAGFRRAVAELFECVWCTGMWAALAALFLFVIGPFGYFAVLMLALSSLATVFQNVSQMITRIGAR